MKTNHAAFQNETKALQQAVSLVRKITGPEIELKENQPLLNQLQLLSTTLNGWRCPLRHQRGYH